MISKYKIYNILISFYNLLGAEGRMNFARYCNVWVEKSQQLKTWIDLINIAECEVFCLFRGRVESLV